MALLMALLQTAGDSDRQVALRSLFNFLTRFLFSLLLSNVQTSGYLACFRPDVPADTLHIRRLP